MQLLIPIIPFLFANVIASQTCRDLDGATECVGLGLQKGQKINITTHQKSLCLLYANNTLIPSNSLINQPHLEVLYFNFTNVHDIERGAFNGLPELTVLGFFGNKISSTKEPVFPQTLKILDLSGNDIEFLDSINWTGLDNLQHLLLSHNFIRTLPETGLEALKNLQHLDLTLNYFENINNSSFKTFNSLSKLNLAYNKIRSIDIDSFSGLNQLNELILEGNELKEIDIENVVANLPKLRIIHLDNNKFKCAKLQRIITVTLFHNITNQIQTQQKHECES